VPVPWYAAVESHDRLAELRRERGVDLVIKPVDSRGARGVVLVRVDANVDVEWAFRQAQEESPSKRVMVEEYLDGPQLSTESVILDGRVFTLACSDRNYPRKLLERYAPYMIENGGCQPTEYLEEVLGPVDEVIGRAAAAIGLERGTLKGDIVLDDDLNPIVIEVAPRLSGGWLCTDQVPLSTDIDLVQAAARIALGEELDPESLRPRSWNPVAVRYFFPPEGRLVAVHGLEELARTEWIHRVELFVEPGEVIAPVTDHTKRAGLVITIGETREEAVSRAQDAVRALRFEVEETGSRADSLSR